MSAVDQLLKFLLEGKSRVAAQMMAEGFSEDELRQAWNEARRLGFSESSGRSRPLRVERGGGCLLTASSSKEHGRGRHNQ